MPCGQIGVLGTLATAQDGRVYRYPAPATAQPNTTTLTLNAVWFNLLKLQPNGWRYVKLSDVEKDVANAAKHQPPYVAATNSLD